MSAPRTAQYAEAIGPGIGRSNFRTMGEFADAVLTRYQQFYDMAFARVRVRVAAGRLSGDALTMGQETDKIARAALRSWLQHSEGIIEGRGSIIQVNRWLRDPTVGSTAYRIPDVRIPGARLSLDGTIGWKTASTPQIIDIRAFSGGDSVIIVRPTVLGGSYVI